MELSKENTNDFIFDLCHSLGFKSNQISSGYARINDMIVRIKNHTPDWSNFYEDLEDDPSIKKIINVTVGDYDNNDHRKSKQTSIQAKKDYPQVFFADLVIDDGDSISGTIKNIKDIIDAKENMKK